MTERETEKYLIEKYCVSRQQAKRLVLAYGADQRELDALLGARDRTPEHRQEDVDKNSIEVSF